MMTILVEEVNACLARINWGNNCSAADSAALEFLLLLWDLGGSGGVGSAEAPRRPSEYGFCCCCCNCGRDRIPALELWSPLASTPGPIRTRSVWSYSSVIVFAAAAEEEEEWGGHTSFDSVVVGPSNDYYYSSLHSSTWTVIVTLSVIVHPSPPSPFSSSTLCCCCYYSPPPPPPGLHPHKYHPRQLCPPIHQHYCRMYISLVRPPTIMYWRAPELASPASPSSTAPSCTCRSV